MLVETDVVFWDKPADAVTWVDWITVIARWVMVAKPVILMFF